MFNDYKNCLFKNEIMLKPLFSTYSPLGKAFEKKKTIGDHGEKQIKAIQNQGQIKKNIYIYL